MDGRPVELTDSWYPADIATGTALVSPGKIKGGAITLLADLGYTVHEAREDIVFRTATAQEATALGLAAGTPVIVLSRTCLTSAGDSIRSVGHGDGRRGPSPAVPADCELRTWHGGRPVEVAWSYYPLELATGTELAGRRRIRGGAPRVMADLGYPQRYFVDAVSARMPTAEEAGLLELPDVPVIRQFRVVYSDDDRPVEVSVLVKGSHLYELTYRLGA